MRPISRVILHCSATPDYPFGVVVKDFSAADVDRWHKERGWAGIGYHYFIRRLGLIEIGRPVERVGAHTEGHNSGSIGVCYAGTRLPTEGQKASLVHLALEFKALFGITSPQWFGHHDFNKGKECPGFSTDSLRDILKKAGI